MFAAKTRDLTPYQARVKELRELRGYSQIDVARRGGFSSGYLGGLETGRTANQRPSRDQVMKVAKGLRATQDETDELLQLAGYPVRGGGARLPSFFDVVNADLRLTSDQRAVLINMYRVLTGLRE